MGTAPPLPERIKGVMNSKVKSTLDAFEVLENSGLAREISELTGIPWRTQLAILMRMQKEGLVKIKTITHTFYGVINVYFLN